MFIENIRNENMRPQWGRTFASICLTINIRCLWHLVIFNKIIKIIRFHFYPINRFVTKNAY